MKKKKLKNSTEKAFKFVNTLKANAEILHEKGDDSAFITTLETSVQKLDDLEKELVTLKETLDAKKFAFKQEKEQTLRLLKNAKEVLKKGEGKKQKPEKKQKPKQPEEQPVVEITEEKQETEPTEDKQPKPKKKPKVEPTEEKQNPEIAEEAETQK
jgi:outer membrane biosynthesis protein TonB